MLDRLYDFSDLWTFVFFGGGAVLCYAFAHLIARLPGRTTRDKDAVDFVVRAQASLFTATVLILGFSMLQVLDNYKKTQEVVARQAVQLDMLDRQMARSGDLRASELRPLLWAYAEFIMRVDWPALQAHQAQGIIVHEAIRPLARGIFALDPQPGRQMIIYNQMLNSLDALGNTRQELFRSAELRLPPEYWCLALGPLPDHDRIEHNARAGLVPGPGDHNSAGIGNRVVRRDRVPDRRTFSRRGGGNADADRERARGNEGTSVSRFRGGRTRCHLRGVVRPNSRLESTKSDGQTVVRRNSQLLTPAVRSRSVERRIDVVRGAAKEARFTVRSS